MMNDTYFDVHFYFRNKDDDKAVVDHVKTEDFKLAMTYYRQYCDKIEQKKSDGCEYYTYISRSICKYPTDGDQWGEINTKTLNEICQFNDQQECINRKKAIKDKSETK